VETPSVNRIAGRIWSATWVTRYGLALGFVVVAMATRNLLTPAWGAAVRLIIFLPAVLFAAWFGGIGPGLLTTAIGGAGAMYLWLSPVHSFHISDPEETVALCSFLVVGALTSAIIERLHLTRRRLEDQTDRLAALAAERTRLIETERQARAEAETANRGKDDLLAMVAHELRNPLAAMIAAFQVMEHAVTGEDRARPRQVILRQAGRLSQMVEDLLDVGRVKNGKIVVQRRLLDLSDVVGNAVATLTDAGKLAQHTLTLHVAPVFVEADPVRIEQVVVNLLSNAVKYTPPGGSIDIALGVEKNIEKGIENNDAVLRIHDTGVGIPHDLLPRLFGLFVQGDRAVHGRTSGLGIGLALVRWLVELHGGRVSACSDGSGQGSTFEVRLPRARPLFKLAKPAKPAPKPAGPVSPPRPVTVLARDSAPRVGVGTGF
jgi:signal transduction histidine kinase